MKRLRKLAILNNLVDKQAMVKKLEKEKAEQEYYKHKDGGGKSNNNLNLSTSDGTRNNNIYQNRTSKILSNGGPATNFHTPTLQGTNVVKELGGKIDFYKRNNKSMLAERGLLTMSKDGKIENNLHDTKNDTIDEAAKKAKANRAESLAMPHVPLSGYAGPLSKT